MSAKTTTTKSPIKKKPTPSALGAFSSKTEPDAPVATTAPRDKNATRHVQVRLSQKQFRTIRQYAFSNETTLQAVFIDAVRAKLASDGTKLD